MAINQDYIVQRPRVEENIVGQNNSGDDNDDDGDGDGDGDDDDDDDGDDGERITHCILQY